MGRSQIGRAILTIRPSPSELHVDEPSEQSSITVNDFYAHMPTHTYIFAPSREMWPAASVNARVKPIADGGKDLSASAWLDRHRQAEQMTWAPGEPIVIRDRIIAGGGWAEHQGVRCFNLYRAPEFAHGDADKAGPWLDHVRRVYPDDEGHIVAWLAHRVQRPSEKINHAIMLGGQQGIGKDTLLEPVKRAVGPWNFSEVSPKNILGRFNGFLKSVILRVSEAHDLGDFDRFSFYDAMKAYTAAPPDVLRVDEKNLREYSIPNCCGVIITSNHKTDGLYLSSDDRRHYVAWSDLTKEDFAPEYWNGLWRWYESGGFGHVAAYLATLDLSAFDPKAPPPKTNAFWDIVGANRSHEDAELADVIDSLGNPSAITIDRIANAADNDLASWMRDRKSRRQIPHRLEQCDYVPVRNTYAKDGLWKLAGRRQAVYAKRLLAPRDRLRAAQELDDAFRREPEPAF
jgi:Family of unknown function (DUF5906)